MRASVVTCDVCNRTQQVAEAGKLPPEGWGLLVVAENPPRDVCRSCLGRILGWAPALDGRRS